MKLKNQPLYDIILSVQSFETQVPFVYNLCQIINYYKHNNSKKQKRINSGKITTDLKFKNMSSSFIRIEGNSNVRLQGCCFSDGNNAAVVDNLMLSSERSVKEMNKELMGKLLTERNFEKVKFNIDGFDILSLINTSYKEIRKYINSIYKIIA